MCDLSPSNNGLPARNRLITARATSSIGNPSDTMGIATATIVGAFCDPASASPASMNPMNKLPESPKNIVAGWKLNRKNPSVTPASAIAKNDTSGFGAISDITNTTIVVNTADPAASPSNPSIKVNALVINSTHNTVSGRQYTHSSALPPKISPKLCTPYPPAYSQIAATVCTANFHRAFSECTSSNRPNRKMMSAGPRRPTMAFSFSSDPLPINRGITIAAITTPINET